MADELRRNDLLDAVGGSNLLVDLQAATPAISNASRYGRIVQDTAMLRRLISVAGEIAELGYDEPDDVTKALSDVAESKVFELADRRGPSTPLSRSGISSTSPSATSSRPMSGEPP